MNTLSSASPSPPTPTPDARAPIWLSLSVLALLCGYLVYRLAPLWHSNEHYAYGWFVPVLCLGLFWERWKRRPKRGIVRPAGGTFLLLALFALGLLAGALFTEIIPYWRFAGWVFAAATLGLILILLYFIGGRSWCRHFAFPILFFLIAVPWPTRFEAPMIDKMSRLNAAVSAATANVLGTPAVRRGMLIETGAGLVGVDEACSGIRSLQASVMIALFFGELFRFGIIRRGILLFSAVGLAFLCNVVRTTYLVRTADTKGLAGLNLYHDQAGLLIMGVTLAGLLVLVWLLRPRKGNARGSDAGRSPTAAVRPSADFEMPPGEAARFVLDPATVADEPAHPRAGTFIRVALIGLAVWVVAIEGGITLWFLPAERHAAAQVAWKFELPSSNGEFRELPISEKIRAMLNFDVGRSAEWRDGGGSAWQVYYLAWQAAQNRYRAAVTCGQARGHAPEVCLQNAGMLLETNLGTQTIEFNGVPLRVSGERFLDRGRTFHIFSCYWEPNEWVQQSAAGTMLATRTVLRALEKRDRGRDEKRVIKVGVWSKPSDAEAWTDFRNQMMLMIGK